MSSPDEHIRELEAKIAQLKQQWPKHSPPASLLQQLDELEERLASALVERSRGDHPENFSVDEGDP